MRSPLLLTLILIASLVQATVYTGRVTDEAGLGLSYATIYPVNDPVIGTATNSDGYFTFEGFLAPNSPIIVSYVGYEKVTITLPPYSSTPYSSTPLLPDTVVFPTIVLTEQPIGLEEMVVSAKQPKYANKRKQMAILLQAVYEQMEQDFPSVWTQYRIVSDVRMDSEGEAWGMEQMIATLAVREDTITFHGDHCKRYINPFIRSRVNAIYADSTLEQFKFKGVQGRKYPEIGQQIRNTANAIDSGVVVHKGLFYLDIAKTDLHRAITDLKHWSVDKENDGETVLTYTEHKDIIGIFVYTIKRHYIVDSQTLSLLRSSCNAEYRLRIPFGMKLDADQLQLLNMLNMSEQQIEKFRLRQVHASIQFNTLYQRKGDYLYVLEKNLHTDATVVGAKKQTIPVVLNATQRVVNIKSPSRPHYVFERTRRLRREIVEIY